MRFRPKYTVLYRGEFYYPDEEFDIAPADELEMSQHGEILEGPEESSGESDGPINGPIYGPIENPVEGKPRRGRRRKNDEPGEDASADE